MATFLFLRRLETAMQKYYPEIPAERSEDLHNLPIVDQADLILFMAGNQFMAMPEMVAGFQQVHPEVRNIFYETLPPGLERCCPRRNLR